MVLVATPDHWHPLPMVEACKAGKDVYVEKPICVAVEEGQKMVAAARANTIASCKSDFGSAPTCTSRKPWSWCRAACWARSALCAPGITANTYPDGQGTYPDSDPPAGLDWDFWLGPAPKVPYNYQRFGVADNRWSTFRYFYDYANGWPGDWAVHLMDIVQWAMKTDGPTGITAIGSKHYIKDNTETPDTLEITWEYPRTSSPRMRAANATAIPCTNTATELSSMAPTPPCSSIATALRSFRNRWRKAITARSTGPPKGRRNIGKWARRLP